MLADLRSSALFGIMHYINYIKTPKFDVVTSLVIFAFCIGCFFCGLLLRTKNIFLVAIIHGLVNFSFGSEVLKSIDPITKAQTQPTFISLFFTLFIWSILFIAGYKMMQLAKKDTKPDTYNNISI